MKISDKYNRYTITHYKETRYSMRKKITGLLMAMVMVASSFIVSPAGVTYADTTQDNTQSTYQKSDIAEDTYNGVTLKVEWNDPKLGEETAFHVSATGGTGKYKFMMGAPMYSSNGMAGTYESVADPSRTEIWKYSDECTSYDYKFEMTASGTYYYNFYVMFKKTSESAWSILKTYTYITVKDATHPSVDSIVNGAVTQCNSIATNNTQYAKALWLHDWLLEQLEYDHSLKWSSAESALTRGLGTCQAYESAYAKLLTAAGIENSETRDTYDGHTWNAMKLDGKWYQVDCTWDDTSDHFYNFDQRHLYFGLTDELMAVAHPGHSKIYTANGYATRSTSLTDNYFVKNGDAQEWADKYATRIQDNLNAGKTDFEMVADNSTYPPSISRIQNGITAYALNQMSWNSNGKEVSLYVIGDATKFYFYAQYASSNGDSLGENVIGRSLTLKDNIDINYYIDLPEEIVNSNDAYMEFQLDNGKVYKVNVKEATLTDKNSKRYKFSCPLNATQMSETVKAKMVVDGKSGKEYAYSIRQYAYQVLSGKVAVTDETIRMVKALLNYGASAQTFFDYKTDNLANSILNDKDKVISTNDFKAYKAIVDNKNSDTGLTYYGSSLICESEMTVRHYFRLGSNHNINEYNFNYVDSDKNITLEPKQYAKDNTLYYIDISGISAYNLNKNYVCNVNKDNSNIVQLTYGPFSYAYSVANSLEAKTTLKNLTNALYLYWSSVDTFANSK